MAITLTQEQPNLVVINLGTNWTWLDIERDSEKNNAKIQAIPGQVTVIMYSEDKSPMPKGSTFAMVRKIVRTSPTNIRMTYIVTQTLFSRLALGAVLRANPALRAKMMLAPSLDEARRLYAEQHMTSKSV